MNDLNYFNKTVWNELLWIRKSLPRSFFHHQFFLLFLPTTFFDLIYEIR